MKSLIYMKMSTLRKNNYIADQGKTGFCVCYPFYNDQLTRTGIKISKCWNYDHYKDKHEILFIGCRKKKNKLKFI